MSFAVQKFAKFSSKPREVHFEGLVHLLRYIRYNKTLGLKYYTDKKDASLSDLLIQDVINTESQFMAISNYSWKDFSDIGRSTG